MFGFLAILIFIFLGGLGMLIWLSYKTSRSTLTNDDYSFIDAEWQKIIRLINDGSEITLHRAIIEADKLTDFVMRRQRVLGSTFKERFDRIKTRLSDASGAWKAHQLRNRLVHESNFDVSPNEIKQALKSYKQALIDLGALKYIARNE
jgi:hypothetical protein